MRFQTTKRIPGQDPDLVLGTLEGCLRSVSNEIVREGRRITFFGLGPSPRAVNRRDTTVIDVHAVDGITTIDADVRFQASAFLGRASQDAVVQAKLDRVFEEMRMRLGLEPWLAQSREEPAESAPAVGTEVLSEALPEVETRHLSMAQAKATQALPDTVGAGSPVTSSEGSEDAVIELLASAAAVSESIEEPEVLVGSERDPQAEVLKTEPTVVEPVLVGSAVGSGGPEERRKQSEPRTITAEVVPTVVSKPKPYPSASKRGLLMLPEAPFEEPVADASIPAPRFRSSLLDADEEVKSSKWLKGSAWAAGIVVLVLAPAAWLYLPSHRFENAAPQPQAQAAPVPVAAGRPSPVPVTPAPPRALPGSDLDPAAMVTEWETAMRSRDAAAQAAFYADPVERYFLRHNVSQEQIQEDKQAAIDRRKGIWTVKLEQVKVTSANDTTAKARVIKHFMVREDGKGVSEWFVPSQLQLHRADGRWQIVSERDLGWATSMDDLDY